MELVVIILSLLVAALGVLALVAPLRLVDLVKSLETPGGLYLAAAVRLVLGSSLLLSATSSRAPAVLRVLGAIIFAAGLITPFFGVDRFGRMIDWWSSHGTFWVRAWGCVAVAFGSLLIYAVTP
jgi:hypothetical protein